MARPTAVADSSGEWFEVWNPTERFVSLAGVTIRDGAGGEHTVASAGASLSIPPGERAVLAIRGDPSANGGVEADYVYEGIALGDGEGAVSLSYAGVLLDEVAWGGGAGFPDAAGASMSLAPGSDHLDNDLGASWCRATSLIWQGGDFGTPGQENDDCACAASDADGDGFGDDGSCASPWVDCDDGDAGSHPGGSDACDDGVDQDCSGADLPCDCASTDEDGDGYGTADACDPTDCDDTDPGIWPGAVEVCDGDDEDCDGVADNGHDDDGDGFTTCAGDCDDTRSSVKPGAAETCNGRDDDCDWLVDEGFDADGDGFTVCGGDCRDTDAGVYYGAPELCNDVDDDCDGHVDEGFDTDGDGFTTCEGDCDDTRSAVKPGAPELCNGFDDDCDTGVDEGFDVDGDGWTVCEGDCNDGRPQTWPGAFEGCNGTDDDCDGLVDEGYDGDGDGHTSCAGDCDDADPAIRPGAADTCDDGIDQDCNGADRPCGCDETDFDGDGYGTAELCGASVDCDDTDPAVHPGAVETCDLVDEDCDGVVDEGFDVDGDGYRTCTGDCNDENEAVNPGRAEVCNLVDDDCDGLLDEGYDGDGDGWTACGGDCDDGDGHVNPGAAEACNGMNDDCDGEVDERNATGCYEYLTDYDGDGFGVGTPACLCEPQAPYTATEGGDCHDGDADAFPGQREYFDSPRPDGSFDYDCNGNAERRWAVMSSCDLDFACIGAGPGWRDYVPSCGVGSYYTERCAVDLFTGCFDDYVYVLTQQCR
ncbi:hypothetical protein L6R50_16835 [Myxococcota bacterium]|nr:hypothetical protein [Myxococcota bacterium]